MSGLEVISISWPLLLVIIVLTGVFAGIIAGLLGVGGGILMVPVFFWGLGLLKFPAEISMHVAVATSLAIIIPTSISSMRAHHARGNVDWSLVKSWGPAIALGALLGGFASKVIDGDILRLVFGIIALLVSINLFRPNTVNFSATLPDSMKLQQSIATMIGILSSLMGIGGGTMTVPTMAMFNYDMKRAVGTASALGLFIALPATIGFIWAGWNKSELPPYSLGYVNLLTVAVMFPLTVLAAPYGAKLAHHMNPAKLKKVFAVFLGITALRMLWSVLS